METRAHTRSLPLLVAAAAALAAGLARADGVSAHLEPGYLAQEVETTDAAGATTRRSTRGLTQNYQLLLDKSLLTNVRGSAGGSYRRLTQSGTAEGGAPERTDDLSHEIFGRLSLGVPALRAEIGADRRSRDAASAQELTTDVLSLTAAWRPLDLPELDLLASRTHDSGPVLGIDATTTSAVFGARYAVAPIELRYLLAWAAREDDVAHLETRGLDQTVQASYSDTLLHGRTRAYASATFIDRRSSIVFAGPGAVVEQQRFPIAGLSLVETVPSPTSEQLVANPAVIDGDLRTGTGLNLGFRPTLAGDSNLREAGARFADTVTTVNAVFVWMDERLPDDVSALLTWRAWRSDDNQTWTPVGVVGTPRFSPTRDRLEIGIETTSARYLKVAAAPLPVLPDARYEDVLVTEVQFALVQVATELPQSQSSQTVSFDGTATTAILRGRDNLTHDVAVQVSRLSAGSLTLYGIVNGLSYLRKVGRLDVSSRVARRDQDSGVGREGQSEWAASLVFRPLSTLHEALSYSGSYSETSRLLSNSLTAHSRADVYEGITAQATAAANLAVVGTERANLGKQANAVLSLVPNRVLTVTVGWLWSEATSYAEGIAEPTARFQRVEITASATPGPALAASGSVSRILVGPRPTTLASGQLSFSPLRGDLQLGITASRTLDTAAESTSTLVAPTLRWNVRRNLYVNASYSILDVEGPVQSTRSRVLSTSATVYL